MLRVLIVWGKLKYQRGDHVGEIAKIEKHSQLSVVLIAGTLAELIMREIENYSGYGYFKYLKGLLERKVIDDIQFTISDEIRKIRNRYVHINIKKVMEDWNGLSIVDEDGLVTFVNEIILSSAEPEAEIPEFYSISLNEDSEKILLLLVELIKSF